MKIIIILQVCFIFFMGYELYDNNKSFSNLVADNDLYETQENINKYNKFITLKSNLERKLEIAKNINYDFLQNNLLNINDEYINYYIYSKKRVFLANKNELFLFAINKKKLILKSSKDVENIQKIISIDNNMILVVQSNTIQFFRIKNETLIRYKLYEIDAIKDVVYHNNILYIASRDSIETLRNNNGILSLINKIPMHMVKKLQIIQDELFAYLYKGLKVFSLNENLILKSHILQKYKILGIQSNDNRNFFLVHNGIITIDTNNVEKTYFDIFDILVFEKIAIFKLNNNNLILEKINHKNELHKYLLNIENDEINYETNDFDTFKYVDKYKIRNDIFIRLNNK